MNRRAFFARPWRDFPQAKTGKALARGGKGKVFFRIPTEMQWFPGG